MHRLAVLLVLALTPPALADEERDGASPSQELPGWSFGFGLGLGGGLGGISAPGSGVPLLVPRLETTVERRIAERAWWVMGLSATYASSRLAPEVSPAPLADGGVETTQAATLASLGVRFWLTDRSAPVILSVAGLGEASYSRALTHGVLFSGGQAFEVGSSAWRARLGASGEVAGERFLTENLSLRIRLQVLQLGYSFGREKASPSGQRTSSSGFTAALPLSPALELRMFF